VERRTKNASDDVRIMVWWAWVDRHRERELRLAGWITVLGVSEMNVDRV
jgi:hypothetical protein